MAAAHFTDCTSFWGVKVKSAARTKCCVRPTLHVQREQWLGEKMECDHEFCHLFQFRWFILFFCSKALEKKETGEIYCFGAWKPCWKNEHRWSYGSSHQRGISDGAMEGQDCLDGHKRSDGFVGFCIRVATKKYGNYEKKMERGLSQVQIIPWNNSKAVFVLVPWVQCLTLLSSMILRDGFVTFTVRNSL